MQQSPVMGTSIFLLMGIAQRIENAHEGIPMSAQENAYVDFSQPAPDNLDGADSVVDFLYNGITRQIGAELGAGANLLFNLPGTRQSWRIRIKEKSQEGVLKSQGKIVFHYNYDGDVCKTRIFK